MSAYVEHTLDKRTQRFIRRFEYGRALPLEYLERLRLANEVFGDDIRLRAIVDTFDGLSIETSQPDVEGEAPEQPQVAELMESMDFAKVPETGPTWYRRVDNILALDAQPWNFICTPDGFVVPFDVPLLRPDGELLDYLRAAV